MSTPTERPYGIRERLEDAIFILLAAALWGAFVSLIWGPH
jgi:hypothetical protein